MKDQGGETVIAASIASWPSRLEQAVFGTDDPRGIFDLLDDFCVAALGTRVREVVFYRRGVGAVFGIELADGRRIVVKVHPAEIVGDRLDGVRRVQRHLADPRPSGSAPWGGQRPSGTALRRPSRCWSGAGSSMATIPPSAA
jgi:hypothetical protein